MAQSTNPTAIAPASSLRVWAALLTLYFVWGSTYVGILFAIETLPPYVMGSLRFLVAGGALLAWSIAMHPRARPSRREIVDSAIVGGLLLGGAMGLVAVAEQTVPSGIAALLIALLPAWLVILGRIFVGEPIRPLVAVGIVIGLAGVAILAGPWEAGGGLDPLGLAALLLSPVLWAIGSIYSARRAERPTDPTRSVALQMLSGSAVMAVLAVVVGDLARFDPAFVSTKSLLALGYLAVIGSIVGYSTYIWLLRNAPLARISTYAYVNPVVAVALGAALAGEAITGRTLVAAAVIVLGVALIVTARARAVAGPDAPDAAAASGTASPSAGTDVPAPGTRPTPGTGPTPGRPASSARSASPVP